MQELPSSCGVVRGRTVVGMSNTERTRPRTLAEALRGWDDAALGHLLQNRPDLASPMPADTSQLAARATTNASAARAINRLDEFSVDLLEALSALAEPVDLKALAARSEEHTSELQSPI